MTQDNVLNDPPRVVERDVLMSSRGGFAVIGDDDLLRTYSASISPLARYDNIILLDFVTSAKLDLGSAS